MLSTGGLVPHPPVLIPEIGGGRLREAADIVRAIKALVEMIAADAPDVLIMSGPHHPEARTAAAGVVTAAKLQGDFERFGAPDVRVELRGSPDIARSILKAMPSGSGGYSIDAAGGFPAFEIEDGELQWDLSVFLALAGRMGFKPDVLPLAISWGDLHGWSAFGEEVYGSLAADFSSTKFGWLASGDLSHCTRESGAYDYHPYGAKFDAIVTDAVRSDEPSGFLALSDGELTLARQCGAASFAGAFGFYGCGRAKSRLLAYNDPFGVGYLVGCFKVNPDV